MRNYEKSYNEELPHITHPEQFILYCLGLWGGRYYVGITRNMEVRLYDHCTGKGSNWTRLFPPKTVLSTTILPSYTVAEKTEALVTKKLRAQYGEDKVRGGPWLHVSPTLVTLSKLIPFYPPTCLENAVDRKTIMKNLNCTDSQAISLLQRMPRVKFLEEYQLPDGMYIHNVYIRDVPDVTFVKK